jgi:signal recognition particle subunit SRP54
MQSMMKQMRKGGIGKMMRALGGMGALRGGMPGLPRK